MAHEMMFVDPSVSTSDRELFLGPFVESDGPIIDLQLGWSMAHVMHATGAFPSVKQAKNNGWDKPLPIGYDEFTVGKKKLKVYILTRFD